MAKKFILWGLILGGIAVVLGALGAHALKPHLSTAQLDSFETGVRYQMYHSLLLMILSTQSKIIDRLLLTLLIMGVVLFSFSIYLLNLKELISIEAINYLGPITPIGGLLLISSWFILIIRTLRNAK